MSDTYWDRQYNNRLIVPDFADYFAAWKTRTAEARAAYMPLHIPYGDHARQAVDLFRAPAPRGTLFFIHGGYWRAFSREDFAWIAPPFLAAGISVALPSYRLCPEVGISDIAADIEQALTTTWSRLGQHERRRLVVSGHSAGGHLTAHCLATKFEGKDAPYITSGLSISGLFDLAPLMRTSMNDDLKLDPISADTLSPLHRPRVSAAPLLSVYGGSEPPEWHHQSDRLASQWPDVTSAALPFRNHFTALDALADPEHSLHEQALGMFA
ncbi:alpha/beta hydrolase [Lacibacterium aquatile]|uniref:Alpha/beta hydrolase n=1 Tax=Lacibacterium aquatile TaxID=1168082 RepID=A0ABW5DMR8_9PROT